MRERENAVSDVGSLTWHEVVGVGGLDLGLVAAVLDVLHGVRHLQQLLVLLTHL